MKSSRSAVNQKTHAIPQLRFEEQELTSFSGLVVFQRLFAYLNLSARLRACFRHLNATPIFAPNKLVLLLIVHLLLGYRDLRHTRFYRDDPLVLRLLGLRQLPDVSTISRQLSSLDERSVQNLEDLQTQLVLERLSSLGTGHITLDFDGSVLGTGRSAEGTAVGFNRKKKGQRSYYPLFCTVAQTGQVLSRLHRSGNVHDSNGADEFILRCVEISRNAMPEARIELRMDSAFFSDEIVKALDRAKVLYTISVPFERFLELKDKIDLRVKWNEINEDTDFFEQRWKPKSWEGKHRFVFVRQFAAVQNKEPLQLDLFKPRDYDCNYQVILTNRRDVAPKVMALHNGRGSQENIFAEMKSQNALGYIPTRTWRGNRVYLLSVIMAHNLSRELQMLTNAPVQRNDAKRPTLWIFEKLDTVRRQIVQRAGRLIEPNGRLTLSMAANNAVRDKILSTLDAIDCAA